ncbi:dentin sialophosphoprotein [Nematostella vectensis]|uniref:dentin sialophosphoprotein n=1 Tax=Nematostella vectensis TaxID=45351 RepID=UPI0020771D59|nr:dentin sialophosphoprotein [Nematostella vectensis]
MPENQEGHDQTSSAVTVDVSAPVQENQEGHDQTFSAVAGGDVSAPVPENQEGHDQDSSGVTCSANEALTENQEDSTLRGGENGAGDKSIDATTPQDQEEHDHQPASSPTTLEGSGNASDTAEPRDQGRNNQPASPPTAESGNADPVCSIESQGEGSLASDQSISSSKDQSQQELRTMIQEILSVSVEDISFPGSAAHKKALTDHRSTEISHGESPSTQFDQKSSHADGELSNDLKNINDDLCPSDSVKPVSSIQGTTEEHETKDSPVATEEQDTERTCVVTETQGSEAALITTEEQEMEKALVATDVQGIKKASVSTEEQDIEKTSVATEEQRTEKSMITTEAQETEDTSVAKQEQETKKTSSAPEEQGKEKSMITTEVQKIEETSVAKQEQGTDETSVATEEQETGKTAGNRSSSEDAIVAPKAEVDLSTPKNSASSAPISIEAANVKQIHTSIISATKAKATASSGQLRHATENATPAQPASSPGLEQPATATVPLVPVTKPTKVAPSPEPQRREIKMTAWDTEYSRNTEGNQQRAATSDTAEDPEDDTQTCTDTAQNPQGCIDRFVQRLRRLLKRRNRVTPTFACDGELNVPVNLSDVNPSAFAEELTMIDSEMLRAIEFDEIKNGAWREIDVEQRSPHVHAMIEFYNRLSAICVANILSKESAKDRAKIITKIIKIAEKCAQFNNFNSCKALLISFRFHVVSRLCDTWKQVPRRAKSTMGHLLAMTSSRDQKAILRRHQKVCKKQGVNSIQFLGDVLHQVHYIERCYSQKISAYKPAAGDLSLNYTHKNVPSGTSTSRVQPSSLSGEAFNPNDVIPETVEQELRHIWQTYQDAAQGYRFSRRPAVKAFLMNATINDPEDNVDLSYDLEPWRKGEDFPHPSQESLL